MWESERPLLYGEPCQAVQLKLTEKMWIALQAAKRTGSRVTMNFGEANVINVGQEVFEFQAHEAALQDVVRIPNQQEEACLEVAQVKYRLLIQRNISEERERNRLRSLGAETKGRTAQVLEKAPKKNAVRKSVSKPIVRSATPPVMRSATPPVRAAETTAVAPRPAARAATPTPPVVRGQTPPPRPAIHAPGPQTKQAPGSKSSKARKTTPQPSTSAAAPDLAVTAALKSCGLRKILIACIGLDRPKKTRLDQMLQDVTSQCPSFKVGKEELRLALKEVAEFKPPGVYELTEYVKKRDLVTLQQELGKSGMKSDTSPKANTAQAEPRLKLPAAADTSLMESPQQTVSPESVTVDSREGGKNKSKGKKEKRSLAKPAQINPSAVETSTDILRDLRERNKRGRELAGSEEAFVEMQTKQIEERLALQDPEPRGVLPEPAYWETSSSAGAEETWFSQYLRQPQSRLTVQDQGSFQALLDEHDSMYNDYVRLGKHIQDFKRKYRALSDAADSAMDDGDKQRLAMQAEQYYTDNLHSIKAMDTAFKSLHADLGHVQKTLANFVEGEGV